MDVKQKEKLLKHIADTIVKINADYDVEVIKEKKILPLVLQDLGYVVKLRLNTTYEYDEEMFSEWKRRLKAEYWYISVKRNQLQITFRVIFKDKKN